MKFDLTFEFVSSAAVYDQCLEHIQKEIAFVGASNTGDTFHTKLDMSPEAIKMMSDLFVGLADIAPYHMILGNHDMNLKNTGRLDAISPIVDYLEHPNIYFHKYASVVEVAPDHCFFEGRFCQ